MWDRSNAYNTFYHDVAIRNLELGGTARQIICNAIVDQTEFAVRTLSHRSNVYTLNTGGPQGQCGTGEIYSIFNKKMTLPKNIETKHPLKAIRNNFVDDSSDPITAHNDDIEEIERQIDEK